MFSEPTWLLLDHFGILLGDLLMGCTVIGAVVGFVRRNDLRRWLRTNSFPEVGGEFDPAEQDWDAVVFTVSREEVPRWVMERVRPRSVAFVGTEQSRPVVERLAAFSGEHSIRVASSHTVDADDPADARRAVAAALTALREAGHTHLAVDVTGGKTPMSIGAFMAAEERQSDSIYVACAFDPRLKKPDMTTARILRISGG